MLKHSTSIYIRNAIYAFVRTVSVELREIQSLWISDARQPSYLGIWMIILRGVFEIRVCISPTFVCDQTMKILCVFE